MAFKVLQHVHTFQPGDTANADDFPVGADMERLVNLGVLRPMDGEPIELLPHDLEGWKALANERGEKLAELSSDPSAAHAEQLAIAEKEIARLQAVIEDLKGSMEKMESEHAARLNDLGDPAEALMGAIRERDEARSALGQWQKAHDKKAAKEAKDKAAKAGKS